MDVPDQRFLLNNQVQGLLSSHPNSCDLEILPDVHWPLLVQHYVSGQSDQPIPQDLAAIINQIKLYQLPRTPIPIPSLLKLSSTVGMSPKKAHEVSRMVTYIVRLIHANNLLRHQLRIVDVGAGKGYLTRSLKYHLPEVHILALDADAGHTSSAQQWERRLLPDANPPINHKTILITPGSLLSVVDDWIRETRSDNQSAGPIPVLFVALHACGSLTLEVLRAYTNSLEGSVWSGAGVVAVGCCYHQMYPSDFPLSRAYRPSGDQSFQLPKSAFHLAAQVPSEWLQSVSPPRATPSAALSVKKILFRAILTPFLEKATPDEPSTHRAIDQETKLKPVLLPCSRRPTAVVDGPSEPDLPATGTGHPVILGRLHDRVYESWSTFLKAVEDKLGIKFAENAFNGLTDDSARVAFERKVQALHAMRCLLGPVVESTILRDRVRWVKDALGSREGLEVQLVNLFDQSTGSGRNVAIVVAPQLPMFNYHKTL